MQWGQIKTIFILTFLVLNIFLFTQFLEKQKQDDIGILEQQDSPIEDKLANENITIPEELPEVQEKEPFISVAQKVFTEEDLNSIENGAQQETEIVNQTFVISKLNDPIKVPENATDQTIEELVENIIMSPEQYNFWDWNEDLNVLVFFQEKSERPIYFNQSGLVLLFLNDQDEISFFTQTMLGEEESRQDKRSLIDPMKAIETLFNANELRFGEEVTKVDIGLHSRVPLADGVQVFVPAWKVTVNNERNYFVNAIEGFVFSSNENKFIEDIIVHDLDRIRKNMPEIELRDDVIQFFTDKLAAMNRGGRE